MMHVRIRAQSGHASLANEGRLPRGLSGHPTPEPHQLHRNLPFQVKHRAAGDAHPVAVKPAVRRPVRPAAKSSARRFCKIAAGKSTPPAPSLSIAFTAKSACKFRLADIAPAQRFGGR